MSEIYVSCEEADDGWIASVSITESGSTSEHNVSIPRDQYNRLTGGSVDPDKLVEESIEFLLEREPQEAIMSSFDLMTIASYFPEYTDSIKERIQRS